MPWSWGATKVPEFTNLLFQKVCVVVCVCVKGGRDSLHYNLNDKKDSGGAQGHMEEGVLFLTPCTPLCFCKPTGSTAFCDEQSHKRINAHNQNM